MSYLQVVVWGRDEGWLKKTCADIRNKGVQSYIKSCVLSSDCCMGRDEGWLKKTCADIRN